MHHKIYIGIVGALFMAFTIVFLFFPRTRYSELEKRELATFPSLGVDSLMNGQFTEAVSQWFSDSEPYREQLMSLGMHFDQWIGRSMRAEGEESFTFHASGVGNLQATDMGEMAIDEETDKLLSDRDIKEFAGIGNDTAHTKKASVGILIVGDVPKVRAMEAYGGCMGGETYAEICNIYKRTFPKVNVYCMVIPTSIEFYCPSAAKSSSTSQLATIRNTYAHLSDSVQAVNIYTTLGEHAAEDIYLRTDHHWSPLGAYYAAQHFANVAKVPFHDLSTYEQHVVHGFVGSMYGFSHDISVKQSPEDFVYYTPTDVNYEVTYTNYTTDAYFHVIGEGRPYKGQFFYHYKDGSGSAYMTFMGGDCKLTHLHTSTTNARRLLILKDSYGNALPGYLMHSFSDIYVVDARYFTKNMVDFVRENQITDILFANYVFKVYGGCRSYLTFLRQKAGVSQRESSAATARKDSTDRPLLIDTIAPSVQTVVAPADSL